MREILFRGKRIDNGEWAYGDLEYSRITDAAFIHTYHPDTKEYAGQVRVTTDTVGQFVGLVDDQGKKVFEGDIVSHPRYTEDKGVVKYMDMGFVIEGKWKDGVYNYYSFCNSAIFKMKPTVIGNIHDNPELIKTERQ